MEEREREKRGSYQDYGGRCLGSAETFDKRAPGKFFRSRQTRFICIHNDATEAAPKKPKLNNGKQAFETSQFLVDCGRFGADLGKAGRFLVVLQWAGAGHALNC